MSPYFVIKTNSGATSEVCCYKRSDDGNYKLVWQSCVILSNEFYSKTRSLPNVGCVLWVHDMRGHGTCIVSVLYSQITLNISRRISRMATSNWKYSAGNDTLKWWWYYSQLFATSLETEYLSHQGCHMIYIKLYEYVKYISSSTGLLLPLPSALS